MSLGLMSAGENFTHFIWLLVSTWLAFAPLSLYTWLV